jgi:hypothetical protein
VFTWVVNHLGSYFGKSIVVHVASSKEDCLAKLMNYDFSPEGLPVSLGGCWTGGCEPWRKGCPVDGDELSLEIETDLSCLFRTVLWSHEQAQQITLPTASLKIAPSNTRITTYTTNVLSLGEESKMPASTTINHQQKEASATSAQITSWRPADEGPLTALHNQAVVALSQQSCSLESHHAPPENGQTEAANDAANEPLVRTVTCTHGRRRTQ